MRHLIEIGTRCFDPEKILGFRAFIDYRSDAGGGWYQWPAVSVITISGEEIEVWAGPHVYGKEGAAEGLETARNVRQALMENMPTSESLYLPTLVNVTEAVLGRCKVKDGWK